MKNIVVNRLNLSALQNCMEKNKIHIGTSGFSYKDWLGNFYPQFVPAADFLRYYCSKFETVEIDSTYYRMPAVETVKKWEKVTCDEFLFCAKFPQSVTHEGNIRERIENASHFVETMRYLQAKLGVLLLQFPYSFKPESRDLLRSLIESMPTDVRIAVELRHKDWLQEEAIFDLFSEKNICFCLIDHPWMPRSEISTADFTYIRLLGDRKKIEADFSYIRDDRSPELTYWSEIIQKQAEHGNEVFAYFNNHYSGHAPTTAYNLMDILYS